MKRYGFMQDDFSKDMESCEKESGEWVRYEDHEAEIKQLREQNEALTEFAIGAIKVFEMFSNLPTDIKHKMQLIKQALSDNGRKT